jgi:hypothetical protein
MLLFAALALSSLQTNELTASVHVSQTAQLFHVVDQMSQWSPYCHAQYRRELPPTAEDEAILATHAQLRQRLGGYGVLDHAFYSDRTVDEAIAALPAETRADAAKVMRHFSPRITPWLLAHAALVSEAKQRLVATERLRVFTAEASRFFLGAKVTLPIFLVPSPEGASGGGYNGDRLTIEVTTKDGALDGARLTDVFFHETWHAFAQGHRDQMNRSLAPYRGLDGTTLSEGLAHAAVPGVYGSPPQKGLQDGARGEPGSSRVRFHQLGLLLLPSLEDALRQRGTIVTYLPQAVAIYRGFQLLAATGEQPKPRFFCFGAQSEKSGQAIFAQGYDTWMRPLSKAGLSELSAKMRPSDVVVIAVKTGEAVPPEFRALFLDKWSEVEASMRAHPSGVWSGVWNDRRIAAAWAADDEALTPMVATVPSNFVGR